MGKKILVFFTVLSVFFAGCKWEKNSPGDDSPVKGTIKISADQAFEPVIKEQIHMYEISYPETKINAEFKSEIDCIKDLINDPETRLVITTRKLTTNEEAEEQITPTTNTNTHNYNSSYKIK